MLDKYKIIRDGKILSGQDGKTGMWYCKELPTDTVRETMVKIGELNKIYNDYNAETKKKNEKEKSKVDSKNL